MPKTRDSEDLIRELLVRELDTVNVYTDMVARARTPAVRDLLIEITRQEKHHIAEAVDMLSRFDPGQAEALERAGLGRPATAPNAESTVRFEPSGITAPLIESDSLLETARINNVDIRHDCGGHGVCGTCRVEILDGAPSLSEVTDPERKHLSELVSENWRLACQVTATASVQLRIPPNTRKSGSDEA